MRKLKLAFLFRAILVALSLLSSSAVAANEAASRPNFVFIYADDWRWDCLGSVQREQGEKARFPWLKTPQMDELANQGMRFREAFVVNSLCSPGRACLLTGRYSHLNGIIGNSTPFPVESDTFATRLKEAGYKTAYCGKWHMGSQRERPGFDFVASFIGQGRYFDCPILLNGQQTPTKGWIDDVSTDHAIKFIEKQPKDQPFFLLLGLKSVHGPRGGENLPETYRELYADDESRDVPNLQATAIYNRDKPNGREKARPDARRYAGHREYMRHVTWIDHSVGRVLDALEQTGRNENTVVVVTSDNGYYLGEHGLGDKRSAYEESMRVPLLIRMPGKGAPRGVVNDDMVLNIDHAETILDLAGAPALAEGQGRSMRPLLAGETPSDWRDTFFYEYFKEGNFPIPTVLAVRTATHKLIKYPGHDEWTEVFDLKNDPYEMNNLVGDDELLKKLEGEFDAQSAAVSFRMPPNVGRAKERPANERPKNRRQVQRQRAKTPQRGESK